MSIEYTNRDIFAFPKSSKLDDREDRKRTRRSAEDAARLAVWARDKSRDRATGKPLKKGGVDPDTRGEVHHLRGRLVSPEMRTDPNGQVLLSASNHIRCDGRGGNLLKLFDPLTLRPATDASKPILFVFYDRTGKELARRIS